MGSELLMLCQQLLKLIIRSWPLAIIAIFYLPQAATANVRASLNEFYSNLLQGRCENNPCTENHDHSQDPITNLGDTVSTAEFRLKEEQFFTRARTGQKAQMQCQISQLENMRKRDVRSLDFQEQVLSDLAQKLPDLRLRYQTHLASRERMRTIQNQMRDIRESQGAALGMGYADEMLARQQARLDEELDVYRKESGLFNTLFTSLWRFDDPSMYSFIMRQITSTRDPQDLLHESLLPKTGNIVYRWVTGTREFSFQEQVLGPMLEKTREDLATLSKPGEMSFATKKVLVEESEWSHFLQDKGDNRDNALLMCRLDRRYVSGDDKVRSHAMNATAIIPFGVGVFARMMSAGRFLRVLTPAAQRSVLANSQALSTASIYLSATGVPIAVDEINRACHQERPEFAYRGPNTCDATTTENFHLVERHRARQENCSLAYLMGGLIATPTVLAYLNRSKAVAAGAGGMTKEVQAAQAARVAERERKLSAYLDESENEIVVSAGKRTRERPAATVARDTSPRGQIDELLTRRRSSAEIRQTLNDRLAVAPEATADLNYVLQQNPRILKDPAKLNYVMDEISGMTNLSRAQREDAFKNMLRVVARWNPKSVQGRLIAFRQASFERDLQKTQRWFFRNNPGADEAMLMRLAREEAYHMRARKLTLARSCGSGRSNPYQAAAVGKFTNWSIAVGTGGAAVSFALANWNDVKDLRWGARLGYELVMSYILSRLFAGISSSSSSGAVGKYVHGNMLGFGGSLIDSSVYAYFFNNDEEKAQAELQRLSESPTFKEDMEELARYVQDRSGPEQFMHEMSGMGDEVAQIFGRPNHDSLTASDIANIDKDALQDPVMREQLMEVIGNRIYSDEIGGNTWGNRFIDRLSFDVSWNTSPMGVPRSVLAGVLAYHVVCRNLDNPATALGGFLVIQGANRYLGSYLFYQKRSEEIGQ